jgi:hypothetical protein
MTINSATLIVKRKLTLARRRVSNFNMPPYSRLCQLRYWHRHILDYVSIQHPTTGYEPLRLTGERRSTLPLRLSSGSPHRHGEASPISTWHWHQQQTPWLGPRGWVRELRMLQLVEAVPSIHYTGSSACLYICSTTIPITIQQDYVSPSEEWLTGCQDSWSQQHNRLPSLGLGIWLTPPMAWAGEWSFGRSSGHGMI